MNRYFNVNNKKSRMIFHSAFLNLWVSKRNNQHKYRTNFLLTEIFFKKSY